MKSRILTISSVSSYNYKPVPYIRIQGKWLKSLGFEIGRKIEVQENEGLIIIQVASADESKEVQ